MGLWTDFLGAEVRFAATPSFGRTRIAEAGKANEEVLILMHGIGGHLETYAKNLIPLSERFHVIAFDFVGHGLSEKRLDIAYTPDLYAEHLREVMDALGVERIHISGESLGGWVAGKFAVRYPQRTLRVVLNTAAGMPIVSEKGRQDLANLVELSKRSAGQQLTFEAVQARMCWLVHEKNWSILDEEHINTRLRIYADRASQRAAALVQQQLSNTTDAELVPYERLSAETLFLWTRSNPIHDLEAAKAACARTPKGSLYVMQGVAAHWPQFEAPGEFNTIVQKFLSSGKT
jgi:HOMODA hydrolase